MHGKIWRFEFLPYICSVKNEITTQKETLKQRQFVRDKFLLQCGNSSVGRAQPCQGWGREFESRFPLTRQSEMTAFLYSTKPHKHTRDRLPHRTVLCRGRRKTSQSNRFHRNNLRIVLRKIVQTENRSVCTIAQNNGYRKPMQKKAGQSTEEGSVCIPSMHRRRSPKSDRRLHDHRRP